MNFLNSKAAMVGVAVIVGGVVLWVITEKLGKAASDALDKANAGTPYGDATKGGSLVDKTVGFLGNETNKASGGTLQALGEWISGTFFDPNADYDPNAKDFVPRKLDVRAQSSFYTR
jgi:hypothetical protein